jgi:hypothetical protein
MSRAHPAHSNPEFERFFEEWLAQRTWEDDGGGSHGAGGGSSEQRRSSYAT